MIIIESRSAMAHALRQSLDPSLKRLLIKRHEQTGNTEQAARFLIVEPPDSVTDIEQAIGFPLVMDDAPCWEWLERHDGGWTEIVFVFSDDGPADVLLVPDIPDIAPELIDLLRRFAPAEQETVGPTSA